MTVFCTFCCAKKDRSPGEIPAVQRYQDQLIKSVYIAAVSLGLKFLIMSGLYGILESSDLIPYYDKILQPSEVPEHSKKVSSQLEALDVRDIILFTQAISEDEKAKPYIDCIKIASQKAGITLKFVDLPASDA
jgi:hypothetical protein